MTPDFTPLEYLFFIGIGAVLGGIVACVLCIAAFLFPVLWPWVSAPVIVGMLGGWVFGLLVR